ncbi:hypothetical protein J5Y09_19950 [Roseomonas sp. PWR1]|uniref:Uncharacterized protein n=1 Tax=Roseomonas nitratireducens TaxID=2820810 RepID=A0ABS4AXU7_9PROT|nr:hypothetical protein [Neoroseomonas nitratireducens]MBP0466210.1 hypothetical protein [Neoroseomonas nitratireducens]
MSGAPLQIRVEVLPEPRPHKPRVVAVAAAIGRAPLLSDLDTMPPPRGAMLPFPPPPNAAADFATIARTALEMGGTVALFVSRHDAAAAERWLESIETEAGR